MQPTQSGKITQRQIYNELGQDPDNYSDGDRPVVEDVGIDNEHNNLVSAKATAKKKLDEYLMSNNQVKKY